MISPITSSCLFKYSERVQCAEWLFILVTFLSHVVRPAELGPAGDEREANSLKLRDHIARADALEKPAADHRNEFGNQILCQEPELTNQEEEIEKQEQAARDLEKAVVGLEIAQGAIEITLGAIRIAAAGTTAEVLRREDAIAHSRTSNGSRPTEFITQGVPLEPLVRRDETGRKTVCSRRRERSVAENPYLYWKTSYQARLKRSPAFTSLLTEASHNFIQPASNSDTSDERQVKLPTTDEANQLLNLLEDLLNTNNQVLRLLDVDLPPITNHASNPGAVILRQYRQRLDRSRSVQRENGKGEHLDGGRFEKGIRKTGYIDEEILGQGRRLVDSSSRAQEVRALSSELMKLNRIKKDVRLKR